MPIMCYAAQRNEQLTVWGEVKLPEGVNLIPKDDKETNR